MSDRNDQGQAVRTTAEETTLLYPEFIGDAVGLSPYIFRTVREDSASE